MCSVTKVTLQSKVKVIVTLWSVEFQHCQTGVYALLNIALHRQIDVGEHRGCIHH